jgi:outer membrane immunogenic protein
MMFRRILLAAAGAIAVAGAASAADIYRAPEGGGYKDAPYVGVNWSGLYVGANAGYGWSANTDNLNPAGPFGGAQVGYNFQRGNFVFGAEADFQAAHISDNNAVDKSELNWFGTVRGRVGYAVDRVLVYGTGGFAFGDVENSKALPGGGSFSSSETQTGWVAGGGAEYKVTPAWSAKAEYQFLSLDASDSNHVLGLGTGDKSEVHTFRIGLNYFMGSGYEPLK